jgi:hypothetical protein
MRKQALILLTMVGVYLWIRRRQQNTLVPAKGADHAAEAEWANEGGANPDVSV